MLRRFLTPAPRYLSAARRAGRGGFTLVELMIAVAIGAFVIAALYALFVGQMRQFMYQDAQMEMHQNMRLGMDIMSRTTRMAGYGTGSSTRGPFGDGGDQDASLSAVISYDGDGPGGSDAITVVSMDPSLVFNTYETAPPLCSTTSLNVVPTVNDQATKLAQLQNGEMILCVDYAGIGEFRSLGLPMVIIGEPVHRCHPGHGRHRLRGLREQLRRDRQPAADHDLLAGRGRDLLHRRRRHRRHRRWQPRAPRPDDGLGLRVAGRR